MIGNKRNKMRRDKNSCKFCDYIIYIRSIVKTLISNAGAYGFSYIFHGNV